MVVAAHVAYVSFVLLGQIAILAGAVCRWQWIRNPWFRWVHLIMIVIVAVEAVLEITCPLTTWERILRHRAGQHTDEGSFVGRLLHDLIFFDAAPWVFTTAYVTFALLVLGMFWLVPPRRRKGGANIASHPLTKGGEGRMNAEGNDQSGSAAIVPPLTKGGRGG